MSGTFQLVGTIAGAYFGPIGSAVGGSIGRLVDQEVFGKAINGPRITAFRATGSAVGTPIVRGYGNNRIGGELIWFGRVRERKETKKTGGIGGFGGQKTNTYEYYATFAVGLQEANGVCLRNIRINGRIWWEDPGYANGNAEYLDQQARLIEFGPGALTADELASYNAAAKKVAASQGRSEYFTFYNGDEDQAVDPTIATYLGEHAPAYRGLAYVVFKELPVTEYGGALPQIEFEVVSGPTVDGQALNIWKSQVLYPWVSGDLDPRDARNVHKYTRQGLLPIEQDTLEEALEDEEAAFGITLDRELLGWHKQNDPDEYVVEASTISPLFGVDPDERESLYLHFNRYTSLLGPRREATIAGVGSPCGAMAGALIDPGDQPFYWTGLYSSGDPVALNPVPGVWQFSLGSAGPSYSPPIPAGATYSNNCTGYPDIDGVFPNLSGFSDNWITVRRIPACPPAICEDKTPLPENPDYCVDSDGNIYPSVTFAETSDGNFLQLSVFETDSGSVTSYPLGPVLNLDYAPHVAHNTQEWWEPYYLAAVEAGTAEAGWTFDATGSGGPGTYPRTATTVCQAILSVESYCEAEPVSVADVIEAEATRCRPLTLADIDTSLVTDTIWGIQYRDNPTGRSAIEQLRTYSFLDVVDGAQLKFVPRGLPAVATLTTDDLAAHDYGSERPPAVEVTRVDDIQLPREVRVNYIDKDADLQPGQQYDRRLITDAVNVQTIELGIAMDADQGKRIATVSLFDQWAARKALDLKVGIPWLMLEPADCIEVPDLGGTTRVRIDRDDLALPGLRALQGVRDEISLYGRTATGATPQIPDTDEDAPLVQGPTTTVILDLPYMGIGDDDAGYWVAFYGLLDSWQAAEGYRSLDGGTTYDSVVSSGSAIAGTVVAPYDGAEMTVRVYGGELLSTTAAAAAAGTNRFAVGVEGRWVIGTFETVVDNGGGEYTLSDLTVGLFNTEWAVIDTSSPTQYLGQAGDAFVMLGTASRVSEEDSIVGDSVLFRPVTSGTVFDNGVDQTFIARGNSRGFVTGFATTTPPAHSDGATYVVGDGATGAWAGYSDYIAHDVDDTWYFEQPENGRQVRTSSGERYQYVAGSPGTWIALQSESETSAALEDVQSYVSELQSEIAGLNGGYVGVKGGDIASAATTNLATATGDFVDVTGTTTITALGNAAAGVFRVARFTGILTLTHNATSLILPTGVNITTAAGDVATFRSLGSGNWVCVTYQKADGTPLVGGGGGSGKVVQVVNTQTGAVATGTGTIPVDDSIPQNTEGNEFMTLTITPTSATNKLKIEVVGYAGSSSAAPFYMAMALFQDSNANAIAVQAKSVGTSTHGAQISLTHFMTAGTTSATTFKVRMGANGAGTTTFNGISGGRLYGGAYASSITITEIVP